MAGVVLRELTGRACFTSKKSLKIVLVLLFRALAGGSELDPRDVGGLLQETSWARVLSGARTPSFP